MPSPWSSALGVAFLLATCGGGAGGSDCAREPIGDVKAFFAGGQASRDLVGVVEHVTPLPDIHGFRYEFRDGARLTWIGRPLPIEIGTTYRFVVDYAPGFPDGSGMLIFAGDELYFAAFTGQAMFQHVLKQGIAGFEISTGEPRCPSRGRSTCHDALVNLPLIITRGAESRTIYHGQSATLGGYRIDALSVQKVKYSSRCADAGLAAISFTITKERR